MNTFFIICMVTAMIATLGILVVGLFSMTKSGEFNKKYGNRLMQARVYLQGLALIMFALAYLTSHHS